MTVLGLSVFTLLSLLSVGFGVESSCAELGFIEPSCSVCVDLQNFIKNNNQEIVKKCKECCVQGEVVEKYTSAVLTMCFCKKGAFPHIVNFIDEETRLPKFQGLKIVYTKGGENPVLTLTTAEGKREELAIDKWKTEHLTLFLESRLIAP